VLTPLVTAFVARRVANRTSAAVARTTA